ncbi:MAG TPA: TonB-dependent receptor [Steroidobacteraceae bacterium]|nr:TonB-dependent receptor [Steroidobacteraceae bacterium]
MRKRWGVAAAVLVAVPAWGQGVPRLEEVEVTAQRRAENVQRAAVAVGVLAAEELLEAGVSKPQELGELLPSLQVAATAAPISVYYLRAAGNFTGNALTDSAVAFNVDGVFIGRPHGTAGFFYDLERIEVLKGPQGTLYGRNATAGAINVLPKGAELGVTAGEASLETGNHGALRADGVANVPLGERAALRIAGFHVRHDGYMDDGLDDQDDIAGRLSVLVEPADAVSLRLVADYFDQQGLGTGASPLDLGPSHRHGVSGAAGGAYYETQWNAIGGRNFEAMPRNQRLDNWYRGVAATLDWATAGGTLTILPARRESHLDTLGAGIGTQVVTLEEDRQSSVEARFASNPGRRLDYIAGAYWFDETNRVPLFVPNTQFTMAVQRYDTGVESAAGFGQLRWSITDRVRATAGARYTHEDKFLRGSFETSVRRCVSPAGCPGNERIPVTQVTPLPHEFDPSDGVITVGALIESDEKATFSKWTWRAALEADLDEDRFLYASYDTGFKSGGFFFSNDSQVFRPENLEAFAVGSKNRLQSGRLKLDFELFHWRYEDQQVSTITQDSQGVTNLATRNVGNATMGGMEMDAEWAATELTRLRLGLQYLDATYDDFRYVTPLASGPPLTGCPVTPGAAGFAVDCSGSRAPYAPEWTVNLGAEHAFRLVGGSELVAGLRLRYQSEMLTGLDFLPPEYQDGYATIGASLAWSSADGRYSVAAYGNNLTDEAVVANSFPPPFGSFVVGTLRPPRLLALRVTARFGS